MGGGIRQNLARTGHQAVPGDVDFWSRTFLKWETQEASVVRRIFEATAAGVTSGRLADQLSREAVPTPRGLTIWGKTTIRRILENEVYLGRQATSVWVPVAGTASTFQRDLTNPRAVVVDGAHEPLVSADLWHAAHAQRQGTSTGLPGLLTGMLWVVHNAAAERARIDRSHGRSYYSAPSSPWLPVEAVNRLVWEGFSGLLRQREGLVALLRCGFEPAGEDAERRAQDLENRRRRLEAKLNTLVEMRAGGEIDRTTFQEKSEETRRRIRELEEEAAAAGRRVESVINGGLDRAVGALAAALGGKLSTDQRRRLLRSVVGRVDVVVRPGPPQPKGDSGRFTRRTAPKWAVAGVYLRLHRYPGPNTTFSDCERSWVTVQVVADGELLLPMESLRRAMEEAA